MLVIFFLISVPYGFIYIGEVLLKICCFQQKMKSCIWMIFVCSQKNYLRAFWVLLSFLKVQRSWRTDTSFILCSSLPCMDNCTKKNQHTFLLQQQCFMLIPTPLSLTYINKSGAVKILLNNMCLTNGGKLPDA